MPRTDDKRRHWRLKDQWPVRNQELWKVGTSPCDPLDIPQYGHTLAAPSLASVERQYGSYLTFLDITGDLDRNAAPEARVTHDRIARYLAHLIELGYAPQSCLLAISGLRSAMRILAPEYDSAWLWRPKGVPIARLLPGSRKTFDVPHTTELFQWGMDLMRRSDHASGRHRLIRYRDGLMIALLAGRPLRIRTFSALKLGQHLIRHDGHWRIVLGPEDMKNRRAVEFDVPTVLEAAIDRYLTEVRPQLLQNRQSDAVWISGLGSPWRSTAMDLRIRNLAKQRFGVEFGPHRFRHALGTTAPIVDPSHPGSAAAVLAIGEKTVREHYDRADAHVVASRFGQALEAERTALAHLAGRLFQDQRDDDQTGPSQDPAVLPDRACAGHTS